VTTRLAIVCAFAGVAALLAAAGVALGLRAKSSSAWSGAQVVRVKEHDFVISVSTHRVAAGPTVFRVENDGPDEHELIVVRDDGRLPLRVDGMTVNEESLTKQILGALEPARAGAVRELRLRLTPGRYLLLCNMYGHYMAGMHSVVDVR
jgi:uncharacterized cupredoxin-like copper-binding protein